MSKFVNFSEHVRNTFDNNEAKFMSFSQLMMDVANGGELEGGISGKEANAKIVAKFREAIGCDEKSSRVEVRRAIRRNQGLLFDLIEETLQNLLVTGWQNDPFFMQYVDVRNLALGDKNEFYIEDDSMLSVMEVSGNHHSIIRQRLGAGSTQSISTKWVGIKIYSEYERLLTNVEDFGTFVQKIYEAYDNYIKQAMYDAMVGYSSSIAATYKKTGTVSAENLRALCELVSMVTGHPVIIMGTRTALRSVTALQNAQYISNDMKQEHYKTGTLGYWEGYELVEIPQGFKRNDLTQNLVSNTLLWVMPVADNKFIKLVNEGDSQMYQITDPGTNVDMTYSAELQTKIGVGILFNMAFGMYDIAG
nr:MAG TPA: capsid protein [Caudoviricetes sp.]